MAWETTNQAHATENIPCRTSASWRNQEGKKAFSDPGQRGLSGYTSDNGENPTRKSIQSTGLVLWTEIMFDLLFLVNLLLTETSRIT